MKREFKPAPPTKADAGKLPMEDLLVKYGWRKVLLWSLGFIAFVGAVVGGIVLMEHLVDRYAPDSIWSALWIPAAIIVLGVIKQIYAPDPGVLIEDDALVVDGRRIERAQLLSVAKLDDEGRHLELRYRKAGKAGEEILKISLMVYAPADRDEIPAAIELWRKA